MFDNKMDPGLLQQIRQCQGLPTLPAIAVQVDAVRDPDAQIPQLARLISKDPALASKILKTVNSSMYQRAQKIAGLDPGSFRCWGSRPCACWCSGFRWYGT